MKLVGATKKYIYNTFIIKNLWCSLAAGLFTLINDFRTMNQPAFAAGGLLTAIPIVILFIVLQKQLVSGLTSGSVKG